MRTFQIKSTLIGLFFLIMSEKRWSLIYECIKRERKGSDHDTVTAVLLILAEKRPQH